MECVAYPIPLLKPQGGRNPIPSLALPLKGREFLVLLFGDRRLVGIFCSFPLRGKVGMGVGLSE